MTTHRIYIFGALGSGTTTLAKALSAYLKTSHLEADDFYWKPTRMPFTEKHPADIRRQNLRKLKGHGNWVLSGNSIYKWFKPIVPYFTLIIYIHLPTEIRLQRLQNTPKGHHRCLLKYDQELQTQNQPFIE